MSTPVPLRDDLPLPTLPSLGFLWSSAAWLVAFATLIVLALPLVVGGEYRPEAQPLLALTTQTSFALAVVLVARTVGLRWRRRAAGIRGVVRAIGAGLSRLAFLLLPGLALLLHLDPGPTAPLMHYALLADDRCGAGHWYVYEVTRWNDVDRQLWLAELNSPLMRPLLRTAATPRCTEQRLHWVEDGVDIKIAMSMGTVGMMTVSATTTP